MNHIKQITPALSEIKTGTPGFKIGSQFFVGGIGGNSIPGITGTDVSDTTAIASDVLSGKYFYTSAGVRTEGTNSGGGTIDFYKCVGFDFGTCTESTTDIEIVGSFVVTSEWGGSTDYSYLVGTYTLVDPAATGTSRQWIHTSGSYYIYYNNDYGAWAIYNSTEGGGYLFCSGANPVGGWSDYEMGGTADGFSRFKINVTPPATKTWYGYKEVYRDGIRFFDTSVKYTNLTYGSEYPIPGRVYNSDCTIEKPYNPSTKPLSFYAREAGTINIGTRNNKPIRDTLHYRIGTSGDWTTATSDTINVAQGEIIQFWNNSTVCNIPSGQTWEGYTYEYSFRIYFTSGKFEGGGSIMSMTNWENTGYFGELFRHYEGTPTADNSHLLSAPELTVTNTTGAGNYEKAYHLIFMNQAALIIPPEVPYLKSPGFSMFQSCKSLTYIPEIKMTSTGIYNNASVCYGCDPEVLKYMYFNCSEWGGTNVFNWYNGNTEFGVFFKSPYLPAETNLDSSTCYKIPRKWIIVDKI